MKEWIIKKEDFIKTSWAGGETIQMVIYPEDAVFANKDFLWRISSASFTSKGSKFSDFTGYQRYILPLKGRLKLDHEGLYKRDLEPYDVEYFDGSWTTLSENSLDCIDYNFIVKSDSQAKLQILEEGQEYELKGPKIVSIFSQEDFQVELTSTRIKDIEGGSLLIMELDEDLKLKLIQAGQPIIITEYKKD